MSEYYSDEDSKEIRRLVKERDEKLALEGVAMTPIVTEKEWLKGKFNGVKVHIVPPGQGKVRQSREVVATLDLAREWLSCFGWVDGEVRRLRYYRDEFYEYEPEERRYVKMEKGVLEKNLSEWLSATHPQYRHFCGTVRMAQIRKNIEEICLVPGSVELPCFHVGTEYVSAAHYIPCRNAIIDVDRMIKFGEEFVHSHGPEFFSIACLPYDFIGGSECPLWDKFLEMALPDEKDRDLLYEWFGYNLIYDTSFERFMIMEGEGKNGKTVCCVVLSQLLGEHNVSAVPLESFGGKSFALSLTLSKLANICEEIGSVDKHDEGNLKKFVTGGITYFDRKGIPGIFGRPTARLTFATNVLPHFSDRSDGIWRRLILLQFKNQIGEGQEDRRYIDPMFWQKSGELPAILDKAIKGLSRLKKRGHFLDSENSREAKEEYRISLNPLEGMFDELFEFNAMGGCLIQEAYDRYKARCSDFGYYPTGIQGFSREVKRIASRRNRQNTVYTQRYHFDKNKNPTFLLGVNILGLSVPSQVHTILQSVKSCVT